MGARNLLTALMLFGVTAASANNDSEIKEAVAAGAGLAVAGMTEASKACFEMVMLAEAARERKAAGESRADLLGRLDRDADVDKAVSVGYEIDSVRDDRVRDMFSSCIRQAGNEFVVN